MGSFIRWNLAYLASDNCSNAGHSLDFSPFPSPLLFLLFFLSCFTVPLLSLTTSRGTRIHVRALPACGIICVTSSLLESSLFDQQHEGASLRVSTPAARDKHPRCGIAFNGDIRFLACRVRVAPYARRRVPAGSSGRVTRSRQQQLCSRRRTRAACPTRNRNL